MTTPTKPMTEAEIEELRKRDADMQPALDKARAELREAEQRSGLLLSEGFSASGGVAFSAASARNSSKRAWSS